MNEWLITHYNKLREITSKVCKIYDIDEIFQFCIEQFLTNKNAHTLSDQDKFYFFARIVRNNFHSKSSPYHKAYRKFVYQPIDNIEVEDKPYEDKDELLWVFQQIEKDKQNGNWYYARLFQIYINQGCSISKTSKKTTIPLNSVSRDVNKYRRWLIERRKNKS